MSGRDLRYIFVYVVFMDRAHLCTGKGKSPSTLWKLKFANIFVIFFTRDSIGCLVYQMVQIDYAITLVARDSEKFLFLPSSLHSTHHIVLHCICLLCILYCFCDIQYQIIVHPRNTAMGSFNIIQNTISYLSSIVNDPISYRFRDGEIPIGDLCKQLMKMRN